MFNITIRRLWLFTQNQAIEIDYTPLAIDVEEDSYLLLHVEDGATHWYTPRVFDEKREIFTWQPISIKFVPAEIRIKALLLS